MVSRQLEGVARSVVERFVIFDLPLQGVAGAGDVDYAVAVGGLDVRPVFALAVGRTIGELKEAVHGYCQTHLALRDCFRPDVADLRRGRVALLGGRHFLNLLRLRLFGCRAA